MLLHASAYPPPSSSFSQSSSSSPGRRIKQKHLWSIPSLRLGLIYGLKWFQRSSYTFLIHRPYLSLLFLLLLFVPMGNIILTMLLGPCYLYTSPLTNNFFFRFLGYGREAREEEQDWVLAYHRLIDDLNLANPWSISWWNPAKNNQIEMGSVAKYRERQNFAGTGVLSLGLDQEKNFQYRYGYGDGDGSPTYTCAARNYLRNIRGVSYERMLSYGPIDIVYTWVNGSDPVWLAKKDKYKEAMFNDNNNKNGQEEKKSNKDNILIDSIEDENKDKKRRRLSLDHFTRHLLANVSERGTTEEENEELSSMTHDFQTKSENSFFNDTTSHYLSMDVFEAGKQEGIKNWLSNSSVANNISFTTEISLEDSDQKATDNRYRDSEELRFSLRSIEKYAPWVRHIYLVTDNQIPKWLNLNSPHITLISHSELFLNKSHLPVFSSPAIESHLHRIPGLSRKFIYFNDDVFLGAPVWPEDFVMPSGTQKVYLSWDVPKCNDGCSDSWIGDGYCDKACNVSACNWDYPDCVNASTSNSYGSSSYSSSSISSKSGSNNAWNNKYFSSTCAKGCPDSWVADKVCDVRCNNEECAWDAGDCGIGLVTDRVPGVTLKQKEYLEVTSSMSNTNVTTSGDNSISNYKIRQIEETISDETKDTERNQTPVISLPYGTPATYLNLSDIFKPYIHHCSSNINDKSYSHERIISTDNSSYGEVVWQNLNMDYDVFTTAEYDNDQFIQNAFLLKKHKMLILLFQHDLGEFDDVYFTDTETNEEQNPKLSLHDLHIQRENLRSRFPMTSEVQIRGKLYFIKNGCETFESKSKIASSSALSTFSQSSVASTESKGHNYGTTTSHLIGSSEKKTGSNLNTESSIDKNDKDEQFLVEINLKLIVELTYPSSYVIPKRQVLRKNKYTPLADPELTHFCAICEGKKKIQWDTGRNSGGEEEKDTESPMLHRPDITLSPYQIFSFPLIEDEKKIEKSLGLWMEFSQIPSSLTERLREEKDLLIQIVRYPEGYQNTENNKVDKLLVEDTDLSQGQFQLEKGKILEYTFQLVEEHENIGSLTTGNSFQGVGIIIMRNRKVYLIPSITHVDEDLARHKVSMLPSLEIGNEDFIVDEDDDLDLLAINELKAQRNASYYEVNGTDHREEENDLTYVYPSIHAEENKIGIPILLGDASKVAKDTWVVGEVKVLSKKSYQPLLCSEILVKWGNLVSNSSVESNASLNQRGDLGRRKRRILLQSDEISYTDTSIKKNKHNEGKRKLKTAPIATKQVKAPFSKEWFQSFHKVPKQTKLTTLKETKGKWKDMLMPSIDSFLKEINIDDIDMKAHQNISYYRNPEFHWLEILKQSTKNFKTSESDENPQNIHRNLLDSFGESLIHVNRLYHEAFGREQRKVPAHMPHMIDKYVIQEMIEKWPKEWDATSSHRFRSGKDMQYGFSFYYYLMNRNKVLPLDLDRLWKETLDTDNDGVLNDNELITLAALYAGDYPSMEDLEEVLKCESEYNTMNEESKVISSQQKDELSYFRYFQSKIKTAFFDNAINSDNSQPKEGFKFRHLQHCPKVLEKLKANVRRPDTWIEGSGEHVSFEMVIDDIDKTRNRLNFVRSKQRKFVCINDNMQNPDEEVKSLLRHFYLSYFPKRSSFELAEHLENKYLYIDEYRNAKIRFTRLRCLLISCLVILVVCLLGDCLFNDDSSLYEETQQDLRESQSDEESNKIK